MFPNDLWIGDPNTKKLYKVENDIVNLISSSLEPRISSVLVSQDMMCVYVANLSNGTISKFRNGQLANSIKVGSLPSGMCEDGAGNIYVSNYGDNTVTKITNPGTTSARTTTINVHSGPRGIFADSRDHVYVACYTANVVDVIVNGSLVETIEVGQAPKAITVDPYDNVWVANYGSNSVSKIFSHRKDLDIALGNLSRGPSAIVSDSSGRIFVANYLGNDVVVIKDGAYEKTIPVGDAPTAIGVTADDTIYVTSEVNGTITKIVEDEVKETFDVCTNPTAFGDFTGCATYNVYHSTGKSGSVVTPPFGLDVMSDEIRRALAKVIGGQVETSADLVSYHNDQYPTVEAALDNLINTDPEIIEFKFTTGGKYEYGQTVSMLQFDWKLNKPMVSGELTIGSTVIKDLVDPDDAIVKKEENAIIVSGLNIKSNSKIVMTVTDENGISVSKSIDIVFENKFLYGAMDQDLTFVSQTVLDGLTKSPLLESPYGKYFKLDCGATGTKTPIIAVPKVWGITLDQIRFLGASLASSSFDVGDVSYTNISGGNQAYTYFRVKSTYTGTIIATIIDLL